MAKNLFRNPMILNGLGDIDDDDDEGNGSAQSGQNPFACGYDDWMTLFATDYDNNGPDLKDYSHWWYAQGYTWEQWLQFGNSADDWQYDQFPAGYNP